MGKNLNIYPPDAEDFESEGLGVLSPTDWQHEEEANGKSLLTIHHPYDEKGLYKLLQREMIVRADVPVRSVPEIHEGSVVTAVELWRVKNTATSHERRMYKSSKSKHRLRTIPAGTPVYVTWKNRDRYKVTTSRYRSGWMDFAALEMVRVDIPFATNEDIEAVTPSVTVCAQLFRIRTVKFGAKEVTAEAEHITYDLLGNSTDVWWYGRYSAQEFLDSVMNNCKVDHVFSAETNIANTSVNFLLQDVNPIYAILDGEDGFIGRYGGEVIRDNFDITILDHAGMDRGLSVDYGKNLLGIKSYVLDSEVVTGIVPVGKKEDGNNLYLPDQRYVPSPNYSQFAVPHIVKLDVRDAKVDDDVSTTLALSRMREAVAAEWRKGVHHPAIKLEVEFARLGDTEEYKGFRELENCYLYDTVHVWHPLIGERVSMTVVSTVWNGMLGRYTKTVLGTPGASMAKNKIGNAQLPKGIDGGKIREHSIGPGVLGDGVIAARHMQADSISTDALQATSVTAEKIAANAIQAGHLEAHSVSAQVVEFVKAKIDEINAGKLTTDEFYASMAQIVTLMVGSITADTIETDQLAAVLGKFVEIHSDYAGVDFANIKDLIANEVIFRKGTMGEVYIDILAVTSANLANAVIGDLVLRGADGKYYRVTVGSDGILSAVEADVSAAEAEKGTTSEGHSIVDTSINMEDLSASTIKASEAIIGKIFTDALTAGKITAGEAMIASAAIPTLYVTAIKAMGDSIDLSANTSIRLLFEMNDQLRAWFRFTAGGMTVGRSDSTYSTLTDSIGFHILQLGEKIGSFAKRQLAAEAVRIGRVDTLQPRMVIREAPDGGLMITKEGLV